MKNLTTETLIQIWEKMSSNSQRRVPNTTHDVFCIKDSSLNYGLMIRFTETKKDDIIDIAIRGIRITYESSIDDQYDMYLILNNFNDLDLYSVFILDLITYSNACDIHSNHYYTIKNRLYRWQLFLSKSSSLGLDQITQQGLFCELLLLLDYLVPISNIQLAVSSWSGPEMHTKDFSLPNCFIEVKSLISSSHPFITISSIHQLDNEIKPLWLSVFYISKNDSGHSIKDIIDDILNVIGNDIELVSLFFEKLADYGYFADITQGPFHRWNTDDVQFFEIIEKFPRILALDVAPQIIDAKYRIDISRCLEYIVPFNSILI